MILYRSVWNILDGFGINLYGLKWISWTIPMCTKEDVSYRNLENACWWVSIWVFPVKWSLLYKWWKRLYCSVSWIRRSCLAPSSTMRVRDVTILNQWNRGETSLFFLLQWTAIKTSLHLVLNFSHSASYACNEVEQLKTQKRNISISYFILNNIDYQICLQKYVSRKYDLFCVASHILWSAEHHSVQQRHYSTNPTL